MRATAGAEVRERAEVGGKCQASSAGTKELEDTASNGWPSHLPGEILSVLFWQMLRLVEGDSSISARMTQRSSVAEITGKRMTSAQASENTHCRVVSLRPAAAPLELRQSQ